MKLQVGSVQINIHKVILFGTNKRAHNLDGYVLNSEDEPIGYYQNYTPRKKRRVINVDTIKPTTSGLLPYRTRDDHAIHKAIIDYAIVYKGAKVTKNDRLKVLEENK